MNGPRQNNYLAPYRPLPWQVAPWRDTSPIILLTGSAGGGKSRLAAEKLHGFCLRYPGAMALMLRKTRVSMTNSTVLFVERKIIGPDRGVRHVTSKSRFEYAASSILAYAGLDDEKQQERLKSVGQDGGIDIGWLEEANEFTEEDYNAIIARMRGKAAPWRQIILSCNPDAPTHWIYRRLILGKEATVYYSQTTDNPENPADYIDSLGKLTGVQADRLRDGKWVQASGLVYDTWSDPGVVSDEADYDPNGGTVLWSVDDGYSGKLDPSTGMFTADSHPRVILFVQQRPNGQLCVFDEYYQVGALSDKQISEALDRPYARPDFAAHGPGFAELRGRLYQAEIMPRMCSVSVEESIKELRSCFAPDQNDQRRVLVHPRCRHLRAEMVAYRYDQNEKPIKQFDHGPDALRYVAWLTRFE